MSTLKQRNELEATILADRPDINPWILKNLLDVFCAEGGKDTLQSLVKEDMKQARKNRNKNAIKPTIPIVMDGVTVSQWDETWETRAREIAEKVGARVLTEEEAEKIRGTTENKTISNVKVEDL